MITYKIKLGQGMIELSGELKDVANMASVFGGLSGRMCDNCKGTNIFLSHNEDKDGNDYYHIDCASCNARLKIGQLKKGGLFIKNGEKFTLYQGKNQPDANPSDEYKEFD